MDHSAVHILLIEEDISYARTVQEHLKKFQGTEFHITLERTGKGGLTRLSGDKSIAVVVLDAGIRDVTALDLTREIREQKIDVPVIVVGAKKDFALAVEALKIGIEDYLVKDEIIESVLPRTILNVLNRTQLKRKIAQVEKEKIIAQKRTEAIKELVVTICHEFNNPLAAIKISTDIVSRQPLGDEERKAVDDLEKSIRRVEKEIIKLRDFNLPL